LYNTYLSAKQQEGNFLISTKLDGCDYQIHCSHIEHAVRAIKFAAFLNMKDEDANEKGTCGVMASHALQEQEVTYTCLYAGALDRFLFENDAVGAVLHQGPSHKQAKKSSNQSKLIFILSDVKLYDFKIADRESILYSMNSTSVAYQCTTRPVLLGLPWIPTRTELQVHVPGHQQMRKQIVCTDVVPYDASLLCALYAAVHYLLENPITTNGLPNLPQPFKVSFPGLHAPLLSLAVRKVGEGLDGHAT